MPRLTALLLVVLVSGLASAGVPAGTSSAPAGPRVLTSFLPLHALTLATAGSRATVENWLPPGVDPHDFQFSPRDLRRLRDARLLIVGGLGLEGWTEARLRHMCGNPDLQVVEASAGIPAGALIQDPCTHEHADEPGHAEHHGEGPNPHFWLDPLLAAHAVTNIARALVEADPAGAAVYAANAASCVGRLHALHREFETTLARCRATPFLTYHNAFPYLARRYDLPLAGVVETGASGDPSARELAALAQRVRHEGVRVLFIDGNPTRLARRLAEDLGLKIATLETLETGTFGPRAYEDGMRRNLEALRRALESPPGP